MLSDQVTPNQTVIVEDGIITRIVPAGSVALAAGSLTIDGAGRYLIPALADMHTRVSDTQSLQLNVAHGPVTLVPAEILLHGPSLHYELKLMGEAGVPPLDLIKAATLNAARVAGQEQRVGSIEAGKQADLLVLHADPLADIGNLQAIDRVVKSGVFFDQEELLPPPEQ